MMMPICVFVTAGCQVVAPSSWNRKLICWYVQSWLTTVRLCPLQDTVQKQLWLTGTVVMSTQMRRNQSTLGAVRRREKRIQTNRRLSSSRTQASLWRSRPREQNPLICRYWWNLWTKLDYYYYPWLLLHVFSFFASLLLHQVSPQEMVQEIHQVLIDREDTCHRTCFSLQLDGNVLDNFSELKSIEGLQEGSLLKVVEGQLLSVCAVTVEPSINNAQVVKCVQVSYQVM